MLKNQGLVFDRTGNDRVQCLILGPFRHPQFDADHRTIFDASVDLTQTGFHMFAADITESERPVMVMRQGGDHVVVLLFQIVRSWMMQKLHPHVDTQSFDAQARRIRQQSRHPFFRRPSFHAQQVTVQVPDPGHYLFPSR